jgi:tripartite-type tricarboxylate transporter receptor subunit TctC
MKSFFAFLLATVVSTAAFAQWKPTGSVDFVVGWPAGGNVDRVGRIIADGFQQRGVSINVVNLAGAGGSIGTNKMLNSPADGKTVLVNSTSFLFNHLMQSPGTQYDVQNDFVHLLAAGAVQHHLYASTKVNESLKEVIENTRSGKKQYTWGVGSAAQEFAARLIEQKIGKPIKIVVYKGGPQMVADLLGGHIDLAIDAGTSTLYASSQNGSAKLLATFDAKNPGPVDTIDAHLPGVTLQAWFGLSLHKNTPKEIVEFYRATMKSVMADPEIKKRLDASGLTLLQGEDFSALVKRDYAQFKSVADIINAKNK